MTAAGGNRGWLFLFCSLLFMMAMLFRATNVIIAPELMRDLALTNRELGLVGAVFFYTFGLAQIPLGLSLDRIGPFRTMIALNLVGAAGAVLFAGATDFGGALLGRVMMGLGVSVNMMGTLKLYTVWFPARRFATIVGLTISIASLGGLLSATPYRLLAEAVGWRNSFSVLALIHLALILGFYLTVRDTPDGAPAGGGEGQDAPGALAALRRLAGNLNYWGIALTMGLRDGTFTAIQSLWAGPFLMFHLGLSPITAGNLLLALNIGPMIGAPVGGFVSDRILGSPRRTGLISLVLLASSTLILTVWPGPQGLYLLAVDLFVLGFSAPFASLLFAHTRTLISPRITGTAFSGINFFSMFGSGLFLHLLGMVLEENTAGPAGAGGNFRLAFFICFSGLVLALIIYFFTREGRPVE